MVDSGDGILAMLRDSTQFDIMKKQFVYQGRRESGYDGYGKYRL